MQVLSPLQDDSSINWMLQASYEIWRRRLATALKHWKAIAEVNTAFASMISGVSALCVPHKVTSAGPLFKFNESISFMVYCDTQEELDYYWERLSAVPEAGQCGWLKDKFGLSWQIVSAIMDEIMRDQDPERVARVTEAFFTMKKFDSPTLQRAYAGT